MYAVVHAQKAVCYNLKVNDLKIVMTFKCHSRSNYAIRRST